MLPLAEVICWAGVALAMTVAIPGASGAVAKHRAYRSGARR